MNPKAKGYLLGAIAEVSYGLNPLFALPLYADGMDPDSVLFFRYLFAFPIIGVMLRVRGRSFRVEWRDVPLLVVMGLLASLSSLTLFLSYNYMAAGIASTILFVYPLMVAMVMALFFHERLSAATLFLMLVAMAGIGLLYKAADGVTLSLTGTLIVLASALVYALYIVGVNQSHLKEVATLSVTFYVLLVGFLLFAVRVWLGDGLTMPTHWYMWGNLLALAVFPTAVSFLCTTAATHYIGPTPTAILGALEPVTAVLVGLFVFDEMLTFRDVVGLVLIIGAVSCIVAGSNITHGLVHIRKLFPRLPRHGHKHAE